MALASDLMGLGMPPFLAKEIAEGGVGPLTITGAGTTFATGTKINTDQFYFQITNSAAGSAISLPTVGGDNGSLLCDLYVIGNTSTATVLLFSSTSVTILANGSNSAGQQLTTKQTAILTPVSTTQWIGIIT
jgi:hypothetical protein